MNHIGPDRMDLYLEGELEAAERSALEAHLEGCPACRETLEDRRTWERAFSGLAPVEVPQGFAAAVMARLSARRRRVLGGLAGSLSVTAAIFAALLGYRLVTGESLAGMLVAAGRSVAGPAGLLVTMAAKVFGLASVLLDVAADFASALWKGLGALGTVYRPEVVGLILVLASGLAALVVFGVKKIVSLGERT